jgi:D-3-phosphoglycerate dehydrogenase
MENIKIVITRRLNSTDIIYITNKLKLNIGEHFSIIEPDNYDEEGICKKVKDADVLLGPFVTEKILSDAKNLRLIQVPWTGMDTFNFAAMKNSNVTVCNSHSNSNAVAEMAIALLMDLLKKISYHDRKMRIGNWNRDQIPLDLKSGMLSDKSVCILGYGNIGRKIGKLVISFGARVIAVDNNTDKNEEVYRLYKGSEWMSAISQADICICTLPLTEKTLKLFNMETLKVIKNGLFLINMSRAEIFEEDAVYKALIEKTLSGFASDIWWNTPKRGETQSYVSVKNRFEELENVVISPHRAGFIENSLPHLDDAIVNISNLFMGNKLINIVDINTGF